METDTLTIRQTVGTGPEALGIVSPRVCLSLVPRKADAGATVFEAVRAIVLVRIGTVDVRASTK
jgi:hypothetical protein